MRRLSLKARYTLSAGGSRSRTPGSMKRVFSLCHSPSNVSAESDERLMCCATARPTWPCARRCPCRGDHRRRRWRAARGRAQRTRAAGRPQCQRRDARDPEAAAKVGSCAARNDARRHAPAVRDLRRSNRARAHPARGVRHADPKAGAAGSVLDILAEPASSTARRPPPACSHPNARRRCSTSSPPVGVDPLPSPIRTPGRV